MKAVLWKAEKHLNFVVGFLLSGNFVIKGRLHKFSTLNTQHWLTVEKCQSLHWLFRNHFVHCDSFAKVTLGESAGGTKAIKFKSYEYTFCFYYAKFGVNLLQHFWLTGLENSLRCCSALASIVKRLMFLETTRCHCGPKTSWSSTTHLLKHFWWVCSSKWSLKLDVET